MKKLLFIITLLFSVSSLFAVKLPEPENSRLYTEFTLTRTAPYLKKPQVSSGFIAMDGKDKLIYKQIEPVLIEITCYNNEILYKRQSGDPVRIDMESNEIMMLFVNQSAVDNFYNITSEEINQKDKYILIPEKNKKIKKIIIIAKKDKVETINIFYINNSNLLYEFRNTVTGVKPDENFFKQM